jgi:hypothetical protein
MSPGSEGNFVMYFTILGGIIGSLPRRNNSSKWGGGMVPYVGVKQCNAIYTYHYYFTSISHKIFKKYFKKI